eukprot:CAMPEP_0117609530 /NCGR_PEP_ID=MMETSP0784-20121206/81385_1 /TAXON_ID=39447 /ORGANISM="" /LENGTH=708 /DNA_ID=CAMNT_0005412865 /DNA_START=94 /DNA_END=2220 /DNA_ORIENTATION=+
MALTMLMCLLGALNVALVAALPALPRKIGPVFSEGVLALEETTASVPASSRSNQTRGPKPAGWFDAFSQGESTYVEGAHETSPDNPLRTVLDGWNPSGKGSAAGLPAEVFHESPSAGSKQAWQTHWPALDAGVAQAQVGDPNGLWYRGSGGSWNEEYKIFSGTGGHKKPAAWFDSSVSQHDAFGRVKEPYAGAGARFPYWEERSVNTTLSCQEQGCIANTTLQAFDGSTEQGMRCRLSLGIHATDFDETYSGEMVEWVIVNGETVNMGCSPGEFGCKDGGQAGEPLYPCFTDMDIALQMDWSGTINVAAKITDFVDECPYQGNLLAAVPSVTCMVMPIDPSPMLGNVPNSPDSPYATVGGDGRVYGDSKVVGPYASRTGGGGGAGYSPGGFSPGSAEASGDLSASADPYGPNFKGTAADVPFGVLPGYGPQSGEPFYPFGTLTNTATTYYAGGDWNFEGDYGQMDAAGIGPNGTNLYGPNGIGPNSASIGPNGASIWPNGTNSSTGGTGIAGAGVGDMGAGSAGQRQISSMVGGRLFRAIAPLSCVEKGCEAWVNMQLNSTAVQFGRCTLTVIVNQTDFDNDESEELIEYIGVESRNISLNIKPGKNPCKEADAGTPLSQEEMVYTAVSGEDVTADAADGMLKVRGKISDYVDDCASNGYLFNALAQVDCEVMGDLPQQEDFVGLMQQTTAVGRRVHHQVARLRGAAT